MLPPQVSGSDKREEAHDHADALFNGINAQILAVGMKTRARRTNAVNHRGACQCNVVCVRAATRVNPADFDAFKACSLFNLTDKLLVFPCRAWRADMRASRVRRVCLHPSRPHRAPRSFCRAARVLHWSRNGCQTQVRRCQEQRWKPCRPFDDDVDAGTRTL